MAYFLDTNVCVQLLRDESSTIATRLASHRPRNIKIPSMVRAELLLGAVKSSRPQTAGKAVARLLAPLELVAFGAEAADAYASVRAELEKQGQLIGPNDLIIAATVLAAGGTLVTHNVREFARVPGLRVEDWG